MRLFERSRKLNYIICICLFVGVIVYTFVRTKDTDMIYFKASADSIVVEGPEDYKINIPYVDIDDIELLKAFERGTSAGGAEGKDLWYGTFENSRYGRYELFAVPDVKTYIAITCNDGKVYVLNRDNAGDTENYYSALIEKLNAR